MCLEGIRGFLYFEKYFFKFIKLWKINIGFGFYFFEKRVDFCMNVDICL